MTAVRICFPSARTMMTKSSAQRVIKVSQVLAVYCTTFIVKSTYAKPFAWRMGKMKHFISDERKLGVADLLV